MNLLIIARRIIKDYVGAYVTMCLCGSVIINIPLHV